MVQIDSPDNHKSQNSKAEQRRILVVDDNKDTADMLRTLLSVEGHQVRTAYDGKTGIKIAEEFQPNVCFLDISLPEMDGYELAGHIRKMMPQVTLIALSGWGMAEDRQRSCEAGFNYHLVKPAEFEDIFKLIQQ